MAGHRRRRPDIVAIMKPVEGKTITFEEVKAFCKDRLSHYKVPLEVIIGNIPRNRPARS